MPIYDTIESLKRVREEILDMADASTNVEYEEGLRAAARLVQSEIDLEVEAERIDKMTPEEVKQYLFSMGYTQERLDASFQRFKDTINKMIAEQTSNT